MEPYHQSLLQTTSSTVQAKPVHPNVHVNTSDIVFRVLLILSIATIAVWANLEASKGFSISIVNDAGKHSSAGKRFSVFYESNDKATRILLNTSRYVENLLYPNDDQESQNTKKQIKSVTLRLAQTKFPNVVSVYSGDQPHEYVIVLSPSIIEEALRDNNVFVSAVLQGMARVWLWDRKGETPMELINGIVEYINTLAGFRTYFYFHMTEVWKPANNEICWKDKDPIKVARFLRHFDNRGEPGGGGGEVVRRLNEGMRSGWRDGIMDDALGIASEQACELLTRHHYPSSSV